MKYLFLCIYLLLALASYSTWKMLPTSQYQGTTIYWVTDPNPARDEQIAIFQRWLKKDASRPQDLRVLIDAANGRREKKVIQGISEANHHRQTHYGIQQHQLCGLSFLQDGQSWRNEDQDDQSS